MLALIIVCALLLLFFLRYFVRLIYRPCRSKVSMVGKTAIVTGGSRGIGFQTALGLAARGCKVIVGCRSKAEKAREEIIKMTHNPNIIFKHLDLNLLESVRKFAKEIQSTEDKIDVLINNAGMGYSEKFVSEDNLNTLMQSNYFGHFLLTHLLIDLLKKSDDGRIIFLSSIVVLTSNLTLDSLNILKEEKDAGFFTGLVAYSNTKVCQLIASNIFAEKLKEFGITCNAVHPGAVYTDFFNNVELVVSIKTFMSCFYFLAYLFFKSAEEGAQPVLRLAISNSYKNVTGTFAWDFKHHPAPRCSKNKKFCEQIWNATEKLVKLSESEKIHFTKK